MTLTPIVSIVGVIDLRDGRAVHARGGNRAEYRPIGDAIALARTYVHGLGVRELYVADLDAIERGMGALQSAVLDEIARTGVPVWVDAGVSTVDAARLVVGAGATRVIVGLETLHDFEALREICSAVGGWRVAFSLDLRNGCPITLPNADHRSMGPLALAERAAQAGARTIVLLDVARVGTGARIDLELVASLRNTVPDVALFVGGGIRDDEDLRSLTEVGCSGALVATALLSGAVHV